MVWQDQVDELTKRKGLARQMGGPDKIAQQHSKGRFPVRERIDQCLEEETFLDGLI